MKKTLLVVAALIATQAMAQEAFTVSTGDAKGGSTYSKMFRELAAVCSKDVQLAEVESKGSLQNMDNLTSNKVNAAIVQSDFLSFTKATDPAKVANIKTLVTLYPEELHFIARGDVKKEGGYLGGLIGGKASPCRNHLGLAAHSNVRGYTRAWVDGAECNVSPVQEVRGAHSQEGRRV